jgi:hypothetical protein
MSATFTPRSFRAAMSTWRLLGAGAVSGPVGRDSAGYSFLKAAAFAEGLIPADQAKEEVHAHQELKALYQGHGFVPTEGERSFLLPPSHRPPARLGAEGQPIRDELRAKYSADARLFDPG